MSPAERFTIVEAQIDIQGVTKFSIIDNTHQSVTAVTFKPESAKLVCDSLNLFNVLNMFYSKK